MTADFPTAAFEHRFEILEHFAGGEGATALVRDRKSHKLWICKVLDDEVPAGEASMLMSLQHPAIPAVREVGQVPDGRVFLVREYAQGTVLSDSMPLDPKDAIALTRQALEALAFVHLRGVLHLDIKPANLLRTESGELRLLDFGLAVRRGNSGQGGTPFFAAPELLLGGSPDPRSDLFSLGAVLVAALWPKRGPLPLARFLRMFPSTTFWEAADVRPEDFPAPFPQFLDRCVARKPQERFSDAQAALEFLVGGVGKPSHALLKPDPVAMFSKALETALSTTPCDLRIEGSTENEREQLALHLLCTDRSVAKYRVEDDAVHVVRGGMPALVVKIPPLDAEMLRPFLQEVLSLQRDVAQAAAQFLIQEVGPSPVAIGYDLVRRAADGQIVPDGARWSWPQAAQGRLTPMPTTPLGPANAETLRSDAAAGRGESAQNRFAAAARGLQPEQERALRRALVQGLLAAGEPARALPLCSDLLGERAQALLDLGRVAEARAALQLAGDGETDAESKRELARTKARLRAAAGEVQAAIEDLRAAIGDTPRAVEIQTLAAMHEQLGNGQVARTLLLGVLPKVPADTMPFLRAAVLTSLGLTERRLGRTVEAHGFLTDARALLLRLGHERHAATATHNLGLAAKDLGMLEEATERFRQARGLFQHIGDPAGAAIAEAALGSTALAAGDAVAAERRLEAAAQQLDEVGARAAAAHTRVMLARALAVQKRPDDARALLDAIDESARVRFPNEIAQVLELMQPPPAPVAVRATEAQSTPSPQPHVQDPQAPSRELFRTFLAVNRRLANESDLDRAMNMLLESAITLTGGRTGYLLIERPDGLQREFQAGTPIAGSHAFSRSLANRAMQQQRTLTGEDALADRELKEMPSIRNLQIRSAVCAPFRSGTGAAGAIYVEHAGRAGAFREEDKSSLEVLADQAAIAVDRMLREEQLAKELEHSRRELAVAQRSTRREASTLIGDSAPMRDLRAQIHKIGPLDLSVLILGETGTGKELVAQSIHQNSAVRSRGPFVAENCSALPPELMERELFGHVAGSFTGADRDRPGLLELASGGTLFLDEVGDMPAALQAKLLRALQEKKIRRIGGSETLDVDVRIVAATHKNLRAMVERGEFREDLFFRLAAVEIHVPPLRDRQGDIDVLAKHFVELQCKQQGVQRSLSESALQQMRGYRWPGNVRELQHVIARAVLLAEGERMDDLMLPQSAATTGDGPHATNANDAANATQHATTQPFATAPMAWPAISLAEAERRTIAAALEHCNGDKSATARLLDISRTALYEKLKRYEIGKQP